MVLEFGLLGRGLPEKLTVCACCLNMACHVHALLRPEWRNWYTHQAQNLARFTPHVGSSPTFGTNLKLLSLTLFCRLIGICYRADRVEASDKTHSQRPEPRGRSIITIAYSAFEMGRRKALVGAAH